jgi:hypothetical protein
MESAATGGQGMNLPMLQQKLQSLSPVPPRDLDDAAQPAAAIAPAAGESEEAGKE